MNYYYSIRHEFPTSWEKRSLYRVIPGGEVQHWYAPGNEWKKSGLYTDEASLTRAGAVHMTLSMVRALQSYSRRMLKRK